MSGELRKRIRGVRRRFDPKTYRVPDSNDRINVLDRLTGADYISLGALLVGWASVLLLIRGEPNWGIVVMFAAFGLDKLDGWYARRTGISSPFGRQVDSFIDVFAYLVPGALLYHVALAPNLLTSLLVGFSVLAFGGLRLVRHNSDGFVSQGGVSYYHGTTVVHTNVVIVANYLLAALVGTWNGWLAGLAIAAVCPLMVSDYKAKKTAASHVLAGALVVVATLLALALETGIL